MIAIIALLMAILIPALTKAREQAKRTVCKTNMKSMCAAVIVFADDNNNQVPPLRLIDGEPNNIQTQNHWSRWWHTADDDMYWNLGFLWRDKYIRQGEVFYCPSPRAGFKYKDYSYPTFPHDIRPTPDASLGVRSSYIYNPICISETNRNRRFKKIYEFESANSLVIVDVLSEGGVAHINGWNVARGDMSIHFVIDKTILDTIKLSGNNFIGTDYKAWVKVMNKLLQR